jgi:hypothetical protein
LTTAHFHHPGEPRAECRDAGPNVVDPVGVAESGRDVQGGHR